MCHLFTHGNGQPKKVSKGSYFYYNVQFYKIFQSISLQNSYRVLLLQIKFQAFKWGFKPEFT